MTDSKTPPDPSEPNPTEDPGSNRRSRNLFGFFLIMASFVLLVVLLGQETLDGSRKTLKPGEFNEHLDAGKIKSVVCEGSRLEGEFHEGAESEASRFIVHLQKEYLVEKKVPYKTTRKLPNGETREVEEEGTYIDYIISKVGASNYEYREPSNLVYTLLFNFGPWLIIFLFLYLFIFRQMRSGGPGGGVLAFGRSRAKLVSQDETGITFNDVAGIEEAKDEVQEIVQFLKDPSPFLQIGGRIPRGVLLIGPPGCGKTLLAKAIAGEASVPFFSICGSDFVEMFVGVGASRVRDLFKQAREKSPCLVFLDEIDAVGRRRGAGLGGGHDEREQTLNAMLVEMDGFETDSGIIVVAATNRPDVLDPALSRPGRFDRQVMIDLPDLKGREAILRVHASKIKMSPEVDLSSAARGTTGCSGADLEAILNEAAIRAALDGRESVLPDDVEESRDKVLFGPQKRSRIMDEADRRLTAYHEAGHALLAHIISEVEPLHKVTILPRGRYLGATMQLPQKDSHTVGRKKALGDLQVFYGGRIAEEIFLGDISAGAVGDIQQATALSRRMVCQWGMSESLGPIEYVEKEEEIFIGRDISKNRVHSDATYEKIDLEIQRILDVSYKEAKSKILQHREQIEIITQALLRHETLSGDDVQAILEGKDIDALKAITTEDPDPTPSHSSPEKTSSKASESKDSLEDFDGAGEPAY